MASWNTFITVNNFVYHIETVLSLLQRFLTTIPTKTFYWRISDRKKYSTYFNCIISVYILLSDIDECSLETDDCSNLTHCINTDGSYLCECIVGFTGEGGSCTGNKLYHYQVKVATDKSSISLAVVPVSHPKEQKPIQIERLRRTV